MTVVYFWDMGSVEVPSRTTADVVVKNLVARYGRGQIFVAGDEEFHEEAVARLKMFPNVSFFNTTGKQKAEELLLYEMNRKRYGVESFLHTL